MMHVREAATIAALLVVTSVGLGTITGCGGDSGSSGSTQATAPSPAAKPVETETATVAAVDPAVAKAAADQIFGTRCLTCHGPTGAGDGPGSAALTPKPRNLQDPTWQSSVTDDHIEKIVMYGGAAVGLSPAMPANPDLMSKPEVVAALRVHIRGLASD